MGIGQGYTHLNPLQLCVQAARLANRRKALHPRLVKSIGGLEQPLGSSFGDLPFKPEHLDFVYNAMGAVTGANGEQIAHATGFGQADLGLGPFKIAGKTGTAQAYSYGSGTGVYGKHGAWKLRDHAWFICFAPFDEPRYAMSVLVEHGGFGAEAAVPKAREIMRVALLKDPELRAKIEKPLPLPDAPETPTTADIVPDLPPTPVDPNSQPGLPQGTPTA
jgi:penicillin-binding protein 2